MRVFQAKEKPERVFSKASTSCHRVKKRTGRECMEIVENRCKREREREKRWHAGTQLATAMWSGLTVGR